MQEAVSQRVRRKCGQELVLFLWEGIGKAGCSGLILVNKGAVFTSLVPGPRPIRAEIHIQTHHTQTVENRQRDSTEITREK